MAKGGAQYKSGSGAGFQREKKPKKTEDPSSAPQSE